LVNKFVEKQTTDPNIGFALFTDQLPNYVPISSQHKWNIEGM